MSQVTYQTKAAFKGLLCRSVFLAALALSPLVATSFAVAQERLRDGLVGAGGGALVGGPVGAVVGGAVGYVAGPTITRSVSGGHRRTYRRHYRHTRHHSMVKPPVVVATPTTNGVQK